MFVLFGAVRGALSLEALSVYFSSARCLGSSPGFEINSGHPGLSDRSSSRNNGIDNSSTE
jgi:hypothetical protein